MSEMRVSPFRPDKRSGKKPHFECIHSPFPASFTLPIQMRQNDALMMKEC